MNTSKSVFNSLQEYNSLRDKTELQKVEFIQNYLKIIPMVLNGLSIQHQ